MLQQVQICVECNKVNDMAFQSQSLERERLLFLYLWAQMCVFVCLHVYQYQNPQN